MAETKTRGGATSDLDDIRGDLDELRRNLAMLMEHVKNSAANRVTGSVEGMTEEARQLYGRLAEEYEEHAETLARQVEERPLSSLLIAFLVGVVAGRILLR
jgi:ElaB/YqjD/DUF883 family membrane-anchored ribosome-binding protein